MRISFIFLLAKDLRTSLLIMKTRSFYSPARIGYIRKVSVDLVQKYFLHDCSTDSISCSKKKESDEKNRQRRDSVTISNPIASKVNTLLSLPIQRSCCRSASASVVVSNPLDASSILCRRLHCRCSSICYHLPLPTPPLLSYITWACRLATAAYVVVSNTLDALYIPCPLPTPLSSSLSSRARLTLPTPPSSLII